MRNTTASRRPRRGGVVAVVVAALAATLGVASSAAASPLGSVDPPAGQWWADYALGLAQRANPALVSHH